jgi:hypothetical protein
MTVLVACGQSSGRGTRLSLLPDAAAGGRAWYWTSTCRSGPRGATGCDPAGPNLGPAQLTGNEWNLGGPASAGSVTMSLDAHGGLTVQGDLTTAPPCTASTCTARSANTWVRGFPSVSYGVTQCSAGTSPPASPDLQLPRPVVDVPRDLIGTTTYEDQVPQATYDVAYDMWLNPSGTTAPCLTDGTIEVMVWTDYDSRALLPGSMQVSTATVPFAIDGTAHAGTQAWSVYASNIYPGGRTAPWGGTVWLVLDGADATSKGTVSVDLSSALAAVGTVLQNDYGWSNFSDTYWLDTIPFGLEFGPASGNPYGGDAAQFSLHLASYCLTAGTTVAKAAC